jgi:hypothetical protein
LEDAVQSPLTLPAEVLAGGMQEVSAKTTTDHTQAAKAKKNRQ